MLGGGEPMTKRHSLVGGSGRYYGLKPDIKVISPWREWDLNSRSKLISYAEERGIAVPQSKRGEPPFSMDANLLHISYEGCVAGQPLTTMATKHHSQCSRKHRPRPPRRLGLRRV